MTTKSYSLLRIFTDEMAMHGDRSLLEVLLEEAKVSKLLGVTVLWGRVGFGHSKLIHTSRFLDHNYPLVVEIVDEDSRLRAFVGKINHIPGIGLITITGVETMLGARDLAS